MACLYMGVCVYGHWVLFRTYGVILVTGQSGLIAHLDGGPVCTLSERRRFSLSAGCSSCPLRTAGVHPSSWNSTTTKRPESSGKVAGSELNSFIFPHGSELQPPMQFFSLLLTQIFVFMCPKKELTFASRRLTPTQTYKAVGGARAATQNARDDERLPAAAPRGQALQLHYCKAEHKRASRAVKESRYRWWVPLCPNMLNSKSRFIWTVLKRHSYLSCVNRPLDLKFSKFERILFGLTFSN